MIDSLPDRITKHIWPEPNTGCWLWGGPTDRKGYGRISFDHGGGRLAHRCVYEAVHGPIPRGMLACHRCDNPSCVNPDHVFVGNAYENSLDMCRKNRQNSKLTPTEVLEIRLRCASGASKSSLASVYGVDRTTVSDAAIGRTWRHLPGALPAPPKPGEVGP